MDRLVGQPERVQLIKINDTPLLSRRLSDASVDFLPWSGHSP
jgi:hypothetical protein